MKKSELLKIIKEEIQKTLALTKYQIVYDDYGDDFIYYKQFDSEEEAKDFAISHSFENQEEKYQTVHDADGHEYEDYVYDYITYYNPPESDETQNKVLGPFMGFSIEPVTNINESTTLTITQLKDAYPFMIFTMQPGNSGIFNGKYMVKAEIKKQNGVIEYLGAIKGPASKEQGLQFLNNIAKKEYDKYY